MLGLQWKHVQGEVNAIHKLDRHYYGMEGIAYKLN